MKLSGIISITACAAMIFSGCGARYKSQTSVSEQMVSGEVSGTITVSACNTWAYKNFLEEGIKIFEAANPGTKIQLDTFAVLETRTVQTEKGAQTVTEYPDPSVTTPDYVRRVNTDLMSGAGADIYAMDVLPLDTLIEAGQLENLDSYMDSDLGFRRQDFRANILDAVKRRNGTYVLPLDYIFIYYAYDPMLIPSSMTEYFGLDKTWTIQELMNLGEKLYTGKNRLLDTNIYGVSEQLMIENFSVFIDKEKKRANFINGGFARILDAATEYEAKGYIIPRKTELLSADEESDRYFFKYNYSNSLLTQFSGIQVKTDGRKGVSDNSEDKIAGIASYAGGKVIFDFNKGFAMNAHSKNKKLAWAFLKFLLSKEMELSTNHDSRSFPIHNQARFEKMELQFAEDGRIMNEDQKQSLAEYRAAVETLSDKINAYLDLDMSLFSLMIEPLSYWLEGSRTSAEAAALIQNKVDLYLSE